MSDQNAKDGIVLGELHGLVQKRGLLVHKTDSDHIDFQFVYKGYPFAARAAVANLVASVEIRATLGHLPYTAEGEGNRQGVLEVLRAARRIFGQRVQLMRDLRLVLHDRRSLDGPMTPTNLLTEMVLMIVEAKPYLDALIQYMKPALAAEPIGDGESVTQEG